MKVALIYKKNIKSKNNLIMIVKILIRMNSLMKNKFVNNDNNMNYWKIYKLNNINNIFNNHNPICKTWWVMDKLKIKLN